MFTIWKLEDGEESLTTFNRDKWHIKSTIKKYREISLKITGKESKKYAGSKNGLAAGRYMIVPSTKSHGGLGEFMMNIYVSGEFKTEYANSFKF